MPHWKSIHIERFRRLEGLRLDNLGTVNLLVGKNNSGKTSVLEALAIACHPTNAFTWIDIGREREMKSARTPVQEVLNWFFPHKVPRENGFEGGATMEAVISTGDSLRVETHYREFRQLEMAPEITAESELGGEELSEYAATLEVKLQRKGADGKLFHTRSSLHEFSGKRYKEPDPAERLVPCQFVSPVSHRTIRQLLAAVDQVLEERLKPDVVRLMQMLAEDVDDIEIRSPQGRGAVIHLHHSGIGHIPLSVEGDGMRRALAFASAAALAKNGVLLVDEVETALHPDALAGIFRFLVQVCRATEVQLFVTTHSLEAVDAMLASVGDELDDLVTYRLPARGSSHPVKRFGGQTLHDLRNEGGLDLR
ncbi:MAG: AAA family ATPase [Verrucomicrobia bacterium]|nr:AAA family ATPase [Verrucomicrobiota bacterium]